MNEKKSNTGLKVIAVLLGVGLLGSLAYTVSLYKDREKTKTVLTQEKEYVVNDLTSLQSEYDKAIMESNATNEELVEARDRITKYIDSVKTMKSDITSLSRYRRQVDLLKKERAFLLKKVDSLTQSNSLLAMERDSTYQELSRQTVFNDSLVVQNTQLADAVEKGSALNLSKFSVDAVRERNSGKLVSTTRARSTDKIKVCFTIADNAIAQAGDKEFFIEVLDPQGNVLGEGNTTTNENGASLAYSKGTAFYYENKNLDVCDYVGKPAGDFQKGKYMAIVYDSNLKILAKNEFELK
tara:strand:+ start:829 stop:1716 length:888 start_codon:yes stop_codon:yes gene_type:complete